MARLSDDAVNQIKQNVSLTRLMETQGYEVKKHGQQFAICCPWHDDKTPSLIITPTTNLWHCKHCDIGGSNIDWIMKTQGVSFRFACEILMKDIGQLENTGGKMVKKNTTTRINSSLAANADNQALLRQVIDYYHQTFKQSPEVHEYLQSRGLCHSELLDHFKLGFANRTLGYQLPAKNRQAGAEIRGQLQEIGLLRSSGHEHFTGSLVVPVIDEHGSITEVYGRKILGNKLRKGTAQHLYLPGPHEGVWNISALAASKEIILCEALIDAMTFWVHGFRNVTASYGTSGFTASHLAAFKQYEIKRVLIAYDRDEAGNKAAAQLAEKLQAEGIECFRILLPKGMDVNEYALQVTPAQKSLGLVIRKAEWMGTGAAPQVATATESEGVVVTDNVEAPTTEPQQPIADEAKEPAVDPIPDPTQASPQPEQAKTVEAEINEHEVVITLGDRRYRIRGLPKNMSYDQLKVNMLVSKEERFHVDTLDMYNAKHRATYIKQAGMELGLEERIIKTDLGKVLLKLEELQEKQIKQALEPEEKTVAVSDADQQQALELLKDPNLLSRILDDFNRAGVVGEETNKLVGYLACVSRKLTRPLAVMIQSSSAAGKSSLMESILALIPEEERVQYSAMTGQSLFYMGDTNLKHKILAIAEEEGVENASYALKLLQSEGQVTIASTGKDESTGNLVTKEYKAEGPVMLFFTTTAIDNDEELVNRCLVLTVDEGKTQTEAIHRAQRQRRTLEGLQNQLQRDSTVQLHHNAQRLLKPLMVLNPYANELTFLSDKTRTRRDHEKYLTLIDSVTLLHQYQRPKKTIKHEGEQIPYIEATLEDIEIANRLANEVLGRTLDELPPQTRSLLYLINAMVTAQCKTLGIDRSDYRFSRRDIRQTTGWSDNQLKVHCRRLEELEYLLIHRGGRGQSIQYELLFSGDVDSSKPQLMGLIDIEQLRQEANNTPKSTYDDNKLDSKEESLASSCPQDGAKLVSSWASENEKYTAITEQNEFIAENLLKSTSLSQKNNASNPTEPVIV